MRAVVINLTRRPDRLARFNAWLEGKGIEVERFAAVDGRELDLADLARRGVITSAHLNMTAGAIGNALSHRALWERCVDAGEPLLILEDDACLSPATGRWLEAVELHLAHCDLVHLGYNRDAWVELAYVPGAWCTIQFDQASWPHVLEALPDLDRGARSGRSILDARLVWGTPAYAVGPAGAANLLRQCVPLDARLPVNRSIPVAIDGVINSLALAGRVHMRAVFPPLAIGPNERADSNILR
jgi:glycosyl transferase family 25